ncbi:retrovirus-related pol polyprotein from transposon opus, partial [Plakobranchus ocellatus]
FARTCELTQKHAQQVEKEFTTVNKLGLAKQRPKHHQNHEKPLTHKNCRNCGRKWPHEGGQKNCPAYNKTCNSCGKANHFASVCKSKTTQPRQVKTKPKQKLNFRKHVHTIQDESASEDDYVFISAISRKGMPVFEIEISGRHTEILADSGASVNILPEQVYNALPTQPALEPCMNRIFPFSSSQPLEVVGKLQAKVQYKDTSRIVSFVVVKTTEIPIIGWNTCQALGLLKAVNKLQKEDITDEFSDVFSGLGKLQDHKVKLHIDETIQPVAQKYRRIPFHIRKQLDKHLNKEEEMGVIEKATGPTPWVSPLVIVPKPKNPDEIRVCVDMRAPNTAIRRERHSTPTLNELSTTLADAKYFSKLDLNQGYHQLELNEESRYITTLATHRGLYRYKRLNFGINSAAEIFQEVIRQTLNGLPGVINVSDDILVYGKSKEVHSQNLRKVLERLRSKNLTLNKKKCEFMKPSIEFLGHIFSAEGFKPCPSKLQEICEMPTPTCASEVRSLLGMMNFCGAHFIPDYATLTYELRRLTQKNTAFKWTEKHDEALRILKIHCLY